MKCVKCGHDFDPGNFSLVLLHEHYGYNWNNEDNQKERPPGILVGQTFTVEQSENIERVRFVNDSGDMDVTFRGANTYRYLDVPYDTFLSVAKSDNPGATIANDIKGKFRFVQIAGDL